MEASVPQIAAQDTDTARSNGTGGGYATWTWKTRIYPIPENFIFPRYFQVFYFFAFFDLLYFYYFNFFFYFS